MISHGSVGNDARGRTAANALHGNGRPAFHAHLCKCLDHCAGRRLADRLTSNPPEHDTDTRDEIVQHIEREAHGGE